MIRVMIAEPYGRVGDFAKKELRREFMIHTCPDKHLIMEEVFKFDPDILVLDIKFPGTESLRIIQTLHSTCSHIKIIAVAHYVDDYTSTRLAQLGVFRFVSTPCRSEYVITMIRDAAFLLAHPDVTDWCLENEIDRVLLDLGFQMGYNRYRCVFEAVIARYHNMDSSMKELYIDVAKCCGGNQQRVEKAIRDAVSDAYENSDKALWMQYFAPHNKREKPYPSNEEFIARLAHYLQCRTRLKKPCFRESMMLSEEAEIEL